jgi:replicative DNA helicase Mcm
LSKRTCDPRLFDLSHDPDLIDNLVGSFASYLYGCKKEKYSILNYIVGGSSEPIHVLMVGDPGTGKTALLNETMKYTTTQDTQSYCFVDRFDSMRRSRQALVLDKTQSNSTHVMVACRPLFGHYSVYRPPVENINIPRGSLGFFDISFILRDIPDKQRDAKIAQAIMWGNHESEAVIPSQLLHSYLIYARNLKPILTEEAKQLLFEYYLELRSSHDDNIVPLSPTQLKSLIKLTEASAKLHLREKAWAEDAQKAIGILTWSLEQLGVDPVTRSYDVDMLFTGRPSVLNGKLIQVVEAFGELENNDPDVREADLYVVLFERYGMNKRTVSNLLRTLVMENIIRPTTPGVYRRT